MCEVSFFFYVLGKPVRFPDPESNGSMKRSYTVREVSLVYAVGTLLQFLAALSLRSVLCRVSSYMQWGVLGFWPEYGKF